MPRTGTPCTEGGPGLFQVARRRLGTFFARAWAGRTARACLFSERVLVPASSTSSRGAKTGSPQPAATRGEHVMFHACRSAVPLWRSFFAIALGALAASCSSAGGSGAGEPTEAGNSAAPVLRTANGQQIFGSGGAASSSDTAAGSSGSTSPVGSTPADSREALKDPVLVSPDAGAGSSPPPATQPPPSAGPQPSDAPSAPSDDDDDDDDGEEDDDD
jgi:hypothetical protein